MLSVAKFEAGTVAVSRERFLVNPEIEKALAPLRQQILSSDRSFLVQFKENSPLFLNSDKELFLRVLFNIVSNAIRYTPEAGSITVSFEELENGDLQTSICNTGSYIEEEHRSLIFNKFSSVRLLKQSAGVQNFGLGLTFCKMAAEAMDGKIYVESDKSVPQTSFIYTVKNHEDN
jgi:K+-sensing histidine kinase KdpD